MLLIKEIKFVSNLRWIKYEEFKSYLKKILSNNENINEENDLKKDPEGKNVLGRPGKNCICIYDKIGIFFPRRPRTLFSFHNL